MRRTRRTRVAAGLLGFGALPGLSACSERVAGPVDGLPPRSIVSEVVTAAAPAQTSARDLSPHLSVGTATANGVAYVSVPPGTYRGGMSATIRNATANTPPTPVLVVAGGFDPVAVAARPEDELELRVLSWSGAVSVTYVKVPKRRPPRVVRTDPPKGRTDVAFNTTIVIVLSEPVAPSTVTAGSITLERGGEPIPGSLALSSDGLQIEFVPLTALRPGTTYALRITTRLTDLSGDSLEAEEEVTFTTAAPLAPLPASAEIAFVSTRAGDTAIYVMSADGSGVTRVMRGFHAAWSPDGSRLAIAARGELDSQDIYIVEADGSSLTRLIRGPLDERTPAWSPDGRRIAYQRDNPRSPPGGYVGYRDGGGVIVITSADGSGTSTVLAGGSRPAWAPDGYRIAFTSMSGTWVEHAAIPFVKCERLLLTDIDYTTVAPLTPGGDTTCATTPAWMPGGSGIVFSMARVRGGSRESLSGFDLFPADLFAINADGTGLTTVVSSPGDDYAPAWSPDGSRIAFTSTRDGRAQIYVASADGSGAVNVSRSGYDDSYPSWRPRR